MVVFSFLIHWLLSAIVGMVSFWTVEIGNLGFVKGVFVRLLSGSMVPLWFFPDWLAHLIGWTPFPFMFQAPLSVYIGRVSSHEIYNMIGIQIVWVVLLASIAGVMWSVGRQKILVQGG